MFAVLGRPVILALFYQAEKEILRHFVCFIKPKFKILIPILVLFLLSGAIFLPTKADANILSSLFGAGDPAYAETNANTVKPPQSGSNSQSPENALQVNGSFQTKDNADEDNNLLNTDGTGTALIPSTGPMGVSDGTNSTDPSLDQTSVYVVRQGDTVATVAKIFNVSVNTILWANDIKRGDKLVEGDVLLILPVSGVEHVVAKGDTLKSIAKKYKADAKEIAFYNDLAENIKLAIGDKLIIPDGEMSDEGGDKPAPNLKASEVKDKNYYATSLLKNIIGFFINPLPTGRKTQGLHGPGRRGIDIGAPTGTNIYASAPGVVTAVKTGCVVGPSRCGGGYGNMAIIEHPNGTRTLYAHMSKVLINPGTQISRGEIVGLVGSTGHSTGPHLHFEVFNAKNPGADWSWAN